MDGIAVQNAHERWAAQVAKALDAEMFVEAISGWGVGAGATAIEKNLDNTLSLLISLCLMKFPFLDPLLL